MTRLAVVHPISLIGKELVERLESRPGLWSDLQLIASRKEEVGTVTRVGGAAAMVQRYDADDFTRVDLAFLCDDLAHTRTQLSELEAAGSTTPLVLLTLDAGAELGPPVIAGLNLEAELAGQILINPHPAVLAIARLLSPLRELEPELASATVLEPVSIHSQAALDEVFDQTRSLLAFKPPSGDGILGGQLAFNLFPSPIPPELLTNQLRSVLGERPAVSLQLLRAGIFHGLSISLFCRFAADPGAEGVRALLAEDERLELVEEPERLGPIDAASRSELLVGSVRSDRGVAGGYWIWAVLDHLVLGVTNAVDIAAARRAPG